MRAIEFLKLPASDQDEHIARLLGWNDDGEMEGWPWQRDTERCEIELDEAPDYATGDDGTLFFEMFDALPREGEYWSYRLTEHYVPTDAMGPKHAAEWRYRVDGVCHKASINLGGAPLPHGPTRNLAVAAALSEARHEENDDAD